MDRWLWCQRCHRAYPENEGRIIKGVYQGYKKFTRKLCKYENCNGSMVLDGFDYYKMRSEKGKSTWPINPSRQIVYRPEVS